MVTWTCHICKEERPDHFIAVMGKDTSEEFDLPPGTMRQNIRYCNDRPKCIEGVVDYKHFGKESND